MGFRLGNSGAKSSTNITMVHHLYALIIGLVMGIIVCSLVVWKLVDRPTESQSHLPEPPIDTRPILTSIQQIGEVRTAKMTFKDVFKEHSERKAEGWFRNIPGADQISRALTHNSATLLVEGSIEAGVDLSKLNKEHIIITGNPAKPSMVTVKLPPIKVYQPDVKMNVDNSKTGLLWHDQSLMTRAYERAKLRIGKEANKSEIQSVARENTKAMLANLVTQLGVPYPIEFVFDKRDDSSSVTSLIKISSASK